MKLGIGSYTFTWAVGVPGHPPKEPLTAEGLLLKAAKLGVKVVQFADNLPLASLSSEERARLANLARSHGLSIEIGTRGIRDSGHLLDYLEIAREFGAPFVRVVVDSAGHEPTPEEVVERLRLVVPEFHRAGVKLAIENHDRFPAQLLAGLVEALGVADVGICLDTVNSFGALEGPEVVVRTLAPYTLNLHVKDFTIRRVQSQMGFIIEGCPAGQGRLNVPWLLGQLRTAGRDVNAILELWMPWEGSLEATIEREGHWAEESVRYLRQWIPE